MAHYAPGLQPDLQARGLQPDLRAHVAEVACRVRSLHTGPARTAHPVQALRVRRIQRIQAE